MMVMKMIAVLTIIPYQTDEKSIITDRQEIIIYLALKIFNRKFCEGNILLFIIFKIFCFTLHWAVFRNMVESCPVGNYLRKL